MEEKEVLEEKKQEIVEEKLPKKNKVNKEIEKLKEEKKGLEDKVLRINAELQNMRRRYEEEIFRIRKYDGEDLAKRVISIADNLERAILLDDSNLTDELSKFLSGFKMIYSNLVNILSEYEIKEIDCNNKEFNPSLMEAVLTAKEEGIEKNQVLEVLQKGYMYKDKLLRPAMVKVSE